MPELIMSYLSHNDPNIFLMQFTGIKDKDGKEIYEGDIIQLPRKDFICIVEWHIEGHAFRLITMKDKSKGWASGKVQVVYNIGYTYNGEKCEVLGNIYENPELLTNQ